jgi:ABC-type branched-subunit amino acid transport system ATPase component
LRSDARCRVPQDDDARRTVAGLEPDSVGGGICTYQVTQPRGGPTVLLVEQNTQRALEIADRAYVFELGRIVSEGAPERLLADRTLLNAYLGQSSPETRQPVYHGPAN